MIGDKMYRRMQLGCSCGHLSRNLNEESRHRHNFPLFCRRPKVKAKAKLPAVRCLCYTDHKDPDSPDHMLQCRRKTFHVTGLCHQHRRKTFHVTGLCHQHRKYENGCATK